MAPVRRDRGGVLLHPLRVSRFLLDLRLGSLLVPMCVVDMTPEVVGGGRYLWLPSARFESTTVQRTPLVSRCLPGLFELAAEILRGVVKHLAAPA